MFKVKISPKADKILQKFDRLVRADIYDWIMKNLEGCDNPRQRGTALTGPLGGIWRYRVGDYRVFAEIKDAEVTILIVDVGHRRYVYKK